MLISSAQPCLLLTQQDVEGLQGGDNFIQVGGKGLCTVYACRRSRMSNPALVVGVRCVLCGVCLSAPAPLAPRPCPVLSHILHTTHTPPTCPPPLLFRTILAFLSPVLPQVITAAVRKCRALVPLISSSYAVQEGPGPCFTRLEFTMAYQRGKPIVPVRHSGAWPPEALELMLTEMNYVPAKVGT